MIAHLRSVFHCSQVTILWQPSNECTLTFGLLIDKSFVWNFPLGFHPTIRIYCPLNLIQVVKIRKVLNFSYCQRSRSSFSTGPIHDFPDFPWTSHLNFTGFQLNFLLFRLSLASTDFGHPCVSFLGSMQCNRAFDSFISKYCYQFEFWLSLPPPPPFLRFRLFWSFWIKQWFDLVVNYFRIFFLFF